MMTRQSAATSKDSKPNVDSALLSHPFVLKNVEPSDPAFNPRRRHALMHVCHCPLSS
jgi:hypothetical protein